MQNWFLTTTLLLIIAGCGYKGPLYLPEKPKPATNSNESDTTVNVNVKNANSNGMRNESSDNNGIGSVIFPK